MQSVLEDLYETIPTLTQREVINYYQDSDSHVGYPTYYPSPAAMTAYNWAKDEIADAHNYYLTENYTAAASSLYLALSDLESCSQILLDTVNSTDSGLGNVSPFVPTDLNGIIGFEVKSGQSAAVPLIVELRQASDLIEQGKTEAQAVSDLTTQGKYDEAGPRFEALLSQIDDLGSSVASNVSFIKTNGNSDIYGRDISVYFFDDAKDKLDSAMRALEKDGVPSTDISCNLILAEHDMKLCNSILGVNDFVLQNGLSLSRNCSLPSSTLPALWPI